MDTAPLRRKTQTISRISFSEPSTVTPEQMYECGLNGLSLQKAADETGLSYSALSRKSGQLKPLYDAWRQGKRDRGTAPKQNALYFDADGLPVFPDADIDAELDELTQHNVPFDDRNDDAVILSPRQLELLPAQSYQRMKVHATKLSTAVLAELLRVIKPNGTVEFTGEVPEAPVDFPEPTSPTTPTVATPTSPATPTAATPTADAKPPKPAKSAKTPPRPRIYFNQNRWEVNVSRNGKKLYIGRFVVRADAERAANAWEQKNI